MKGIRIHLSTAVVLMLAASVLLWANTRRNTTFIIDRHPFLAQYGWPVRIEYDTFYLDNEEAATSPQISYIRWSGIALNGGIGVAILLACGVVCEWRIGRRQITARDQYKRPAQRRMG